MKLKGFRGIGVGVCLAIIGGCGGNGEPLEMKMDLWGDGGYSSPTMVSLNDGQFFHNGFPTDLRRSQNSGHIDIGDFPRRSHLFTARYINLVEEGIQQTGYHTVMPIYLPFTGPLDVDQLPAHDADYARADAPVQVVDVDPDSPEYGRRFPLQISITRSVDHYRPGNLLQVVPTLGVTLRNNTTYAAVVTAGAPLPAGYRWRQHPQLAGLLEPDSGTGVPDRAYEVFEPLRHFIQAHGHHGRHSVDHRRPHRPPASRGGTRGFPAAGSGAQSAFAGGVSGLLHYPGGSGCSGIPKRHRALCVAFRWCGLESAGVSAAAVHPYRTVRGDHSQVQGNA